jgi:sulfur carrier protein ThiS
MNCEGEMGRRAGNLRRIGYDRIEKMPVKLLLRDQEYEVKPGMTLLSALQKSNIVPESVIATREGEMILEDEILRDGDVIKLIAVISGGSCHTRTPRHAQRPRPGSEAITNSRGRFAASPLRGSQ